MQQQKGENMSTREQDKLVEEENEKEELKNIIIKIEGEHMFTLYDNHLNIKKCDT